MAPGILSPPVLAYVRCVESQSLLLGFQALMLLRRGFCFLSNR
jgi:hypothetical protein